MHFEYSVDPTGSGDLIFSGRVASTELLTERIALLISKQTVERVVEMIVKEKGAEIMASINLETIANMVIAQAAAQIPSKISGAGNPIGTFGICQNCGHGLPKLNARTL